jgi:hypothetical protein
VQIRRMGFVVLAFVLTVPVMSSMALDTPKKDPAKSSKSSTTTTTTSGSKTVAKKDPKAPAPK